MSILEITNTFLKASEAWVVSGYSIEVRFLASATSDGYRIWEANISLMPLHGGEPNRFQLEVDGLLAGNVQLVARDKTEILSFLKDVTNGIIRLPDRTLKLSGSEFELYSEMSHRERWYSDLHLQVSGDKIETPSQFVLAGLDNRLRLSEKPFDGLNDLSSWLGLKAPGSNSFRSLINVRVGPPIDLIFDRCGLRNDTITITAHAHAEFDTSSAKIGVWATPGKGLENRRQVGHAFDWKNIEGNRVEGVAQVAFNNMDQALVMILIGDSVVRRQWFVDPTKARNNRLLAIQHFDKELKMIRQSVLESSDSDKFEKGVANLLFLVGFSPVILIETDAPDLVVATPGGRLIVIECTTRIADFQSKVGKLVDRRGALSKALSESGHPAKVYAVLVCRLPRDQIAAQAVDLRAHSTILVSGDDLTESFNQLRFPHDPDRMIEEAEQRLLGVGNALPN